MNLQIKLLRDFYNPLSKKTHKAESLIEVDADAYGVPTNSFWYEQLRFEENKSYFEIQNSTSTTKKTK